MTTSFESAFGAAKELASAARWDDLAEALVDLQGSAARIRGIEGHVAEGPLLSYLRSAEEAARKHDGDRVLHNLQRAERFIV